MRARSARAAVALCMALSIAAASGLAGCKVATEPVTASRESLGTVVAVTAWGENADALRESVDAAFDEMAAVEGELDAYDPGSDIARFNQTPFAWGRLPDTAVSVLDRIDALDVRRHFSPTLLAVTRLYDFGGEGSVPDTTSLEVTAYEASRFERQGSEARFAGGPVPRLLGPMPDPDAGLDFGGAAKGLALDRAVARLRRTRGIRALMISTVSSTVVWGAKPDGQPWRIGIEDPRAAGSVLAVVSGEDTRTLNVSTSGDYQQYFERDGVRYHHILDPKTGRPARGIRSLTVFGRLSGTDADILSTALFVAGKADALAYARRAGVGVYLVDAEGKAASYVPPDLDGITLTVEAEPRP